MWDNSKPESSPQAIKTIPLATSSGGVLDMAWRLGIGSNCHARVQLVALSSGGEHLIFPVCQNQFCFTDTASAPGLITAAHPGQSLFDFGSITCYESTVASTVGSGVFVRDTENGAFVTIVIWYQLNASKASFSTSISAASFTHNLPLLNGSRVTHVHLVSKTRLLVFLLQESKMCVDASGDWTSGVASLLINCCNSIEFDILKGASIREVTTQDRP